MNKIRIYNEEEINKLLKNPNIESIKNKRSIIYKNSFKLWAVKEKIKNEEKTAKEIFIDGGFDMNILDDRTPQRRLCSWKRKYELFGEDYFRDDRLFYKAIQNKSKGYQCKLFNDPNFIALIIEKEDDGTINSRVVRKLQNEKDDN